MRNLKNKTSKNIPMIKEVGNSCLECPFFSLKSHGNSASGNCRAPDLNRAIKKNVKRHGNTELKITGKYSSSSIIKVPRPKWCPLNIGDAIITARKEPYGIPENVNYNLKNNTLEEKWDSF